MNLELQGQGIVATILPPKGLFPKLNPGIEGIEGIDIPRVGIRARPSYGDNVRDSITNAAEIANAVARSSFIFLFYNTCKF